MNILFLKIYIVASFNFLNILIGNQLIAIDNDLSNQEENKKDINLENTFFDSWNPFKEKKAANPLLEEKQKLLHSYLGNAWKKFGMKSKDGILISLAALHSKTSCGIGEFPDLNILIPWCKEVGFKVIQLLPINDSEQSPYALLSSCALNPRYLGIQQLPDFHKFPELKKMAHELVLRNSDLRIDVYFISQEKEKLLNLYFNKMGKVILENIDYKNFFHENKEWLIDYAIFKSIREQYLDTTHWEDWEDQYKNLKENREFLLKKFAERIDFYCVIQYLCFTQLAEVKSLADANNISLIGDLPLSVSKNSADTYAYPNIFYPNATLGTSPTLTDSYGENNDIAAYNWEAIKKQDYSWWSQRIKLLTKNFDIYKLDQTLYYFRQWVIGRNKSQFIPAEINDSLQLGKTNLKKLISFSNSLPVAETYGSGFDQEFVTIIEQLGLPKIQVSTRERKKNSNFFDPQDYSFATLLTISTYDSERFVAHWSHYYNFAKEYAEFHKWRPTSDPSELEVYEVLLDIHNSNACLRINPLQEYLWLLDGQTNLLDDERIYIPKVSTPWNWGYRYRPSVEEIVGISYLKKIIISLLNNKDFPVIP
jgi:4-alpha-glucanotransferase